MIVKMELDFVFPRERRVEKELFSDRDISIQGTGSYLSYRFFFFLTSYSTQLSSI